jgi:DEAD/DEAH box helicase domain-containing protein
VVLAGWPGTTASFWQRLGRAGRTGGAAAGVLVAQQDPLDHYLVTHPEQLVGRPPEDAIIDPANHHLLAPHLRCACQELPLDAVEAEQRFGPTRPALLDADVEAGVLRLRGGRYHWTSRKRAAGEVDLRSGGGRSIRIVDTGTGALIGDVDEARAHRQVHPGAIYLHQGRTFEVAELDLDRELALVEEVGQRSWTTRPRSDTDVRIIDELAAETWDDVEVRLGRVEVTTQVTGYDVLRLGSNEVLDRHDLDLPPLHLHTVAVWYAVDEQTPAGRRHRLAGRAGGAARGRARRDRDAAAAGAVRPLGPRRPVDRAPSGHRPGHGVRLRRPSRRRGARGALLPAPAGAPGDDPHHHRHVRLPPRVPVVRAVTQVRQRQRPAAQGRGDPRARPAARPGPATAARPA